MGANFEERKEQTMKDTSAPNNLRVEPRTPKWFIVLLLVGATLLGGTLLREPIAYAAQTVDLTIVGPLDKDGNAQLAGTWTVTVNRPAPLPPVASLQVYTDDGSMVESGNDSSTSRSPQYGSWERVGGGEYAATGVFFRFDPQTGAFLGKQTINRMIDLSQDGQSFTFQGRATIYDANGNVVASVPVSGSGQRLQVEQQS